MKNAQALIIEDFPNLAELFAHAMQDAGYETEIVGDGQIALQRLQEIVPDVILLDLHLPNVSGEDILTQIRADERLSGTRVIITSAEGTHAEQLSAKVDLILNKPIDYHQLRHLASRLHPSYRAA